ncbi:hypothetical protein ACOMICROBIO_EPCKBFOG_03271 [Vibrio sp. B1FLJ16]|nr:hypothetical protein ACOMICROBIO_EPCKBFOG_03271 [Vibrio sp. B1FLJ16]CAD7818980.1 hypothetical protein ACOMICROBIO_FLGHMIGD_03804 [Vibrio sp. B1FLJ16]CAE6932732.1 hypothetical protein ACOMICROBIO_EPCKBFOG_03271 [Vibrio sp. B1FLJ16]CAE6936890.1 hypothetical protein ACOMICROBIO_FLGHMIGD_03804 [Vibrio sp. B1FLJ16]
MDGSLHQHDLVTSLSPKLTQAFACPHKGQASGSGVTVLIFTLNLALRNAYLNNMDE